MSKYDDLKTQIKELNEKCHNRIKNDIEETKNRNSTEYIVIRNYLQKKSFYIEDLSELTKNTSRNITDLLKKLKFIRFKQKKLIIQHKRLNWLRRLIEDFIVFLNYPINKKSSRSIKIINYFIKNQKLDPRDFKIALAGVIEFKPENHKFFTEDELENMSSIIRNASWGMSMYYFRQLYLIYLERYPEIQSIQLDSIESEKDDKENAESDDVIAEIEEIDIKELVNENEKLSEDLSESRAAFDFIAMQYEDLKSKLEESKKDVYDKVLVKIFKNFNSVENNNVLDAFFIAKFTLNKLKQSGWKPSPPELNSALYMFNLFSEFFKRQGLITRYDIEERIEIILENVDDFDYKGTDIIEGVKVKAKVLSPVWYHNDNKVSTATILATKNIED